MTRELLVPRTESSEGMEEWRGGMKDSNQGQQAEPLSVAGNRNSLVVVPSLAELLVVVMG